MRFILSTALLALSITGTAVAFQQAAPASTSTKVDAEVIAEQLPSYPLTQCPVSHEGLDAMGKPVDLVHEGRLVRLCCKSCVKAFKKDPATILKSIDEAVVKAQLPTYPLKTCPISGEELGGMGAPVDFVQGTRLVRFCCKSCLKEFQKEPAKTMAKIDAALITEQKKTYPLTTCLVSGEPLEGEAFDHLYGTRLVRLCCEKCAVAFDEEPAKFLATLDKAPAKSMDEKQAPKKN